MAQILLGEQWRQAVQVIQILARRSGLGELGHDVRLPRARQAHVPTVVLVVRVVAFVVIVLTFAGGRGMIALAYAEFIASAVSLAVGLSC